MVQLATTFPGVGTWKYNDKCGKTYSEKSHYLTNECNVRRHFSA